MTWTNSAGLTFTRTIDVDDKFMFTVTQSRSRTPASETHRIAPYIPDRTTSVNLLIKKGFFIMHEGAIRQTGELLDEIDWDDLRDFENDPNWGPNADVAEVQANGWVGFTDHYWMTTLVPAGRRALHHQCCNMTTRHRHLSRGRTRGNTVELQPGASSQVVTKFFAGAKEWEAIREYENDK